MIFLWHQNIKILFYKPFLLRLLQGSWLAEIILFDFVFKKSRPVCQLISGTSLECSKLILSYYNERFLILLHYGFFFSSEINFTKRFFVPWFSVKLKRLTQPWNFRCYCISSKSDSYYLCLILFRLCQIKKIKVYITPYFNNSFFF